MSTSTRSSSFLKYSEHTEYWFVVVNTARGVADVVGVACEQGCMETRELTAGQVAGQVFLHTTLPSKKRSLRAGTLQDSKLCLGSSLVAKRFVHRVRLVLRVRASHLGYGPMTVCPVLTRPQKAGLEGNPTQHHHSDSSGAEKNNDGGRGRPEL